MSRSYHLNQTLKDFAFYQKHKIVPAPMPGPSADFIKKQCDTMVEMGKITAQLSPFAMPKNLPELNRRALAATVADELRTEGHQIKHRTNPHE